MTLCVFLSIPRPFMDIQDEFEWQSWTDGLYDIVPGNREIVIVTVTELELLAVTDAYPQVQILEKFQPNGLRAGLVLFIDEDGVRNVSGSHNYNPQTSVLESGLKPGHVLDDDNVMRFYGWEKRDYVA